MRRWILCLTLLIMFSMLGSTHAEAQDRTPTYWLAWISGSQYSATEEQVDIFVWDGDKTFNLTQNAAIEGALLWSPDGRLAWISVEIVVSSTELFSSTETQTSSIFVWDGTEITLVNSIVGQIRNLTWTDEGQLVWLTEFAREAGWGGAISYWDGSQTHIISEGMYNYGSLDVSHDGRVAWSYGKNGDTDIYVWDGTNITNITQSKDADGSLHWSPDGRLVWTAHQRLSWDFELYVWDGTQSINVTQYRGEDRFYGWSPNGELVFGSFRRNGALAWEVYLWDGSRIINMTNQNIALVPVWSLDGHMALFVEETRSYFVTLTVQNETQTHLIFRDTGRIYTMQWSPDGSRLSWSFEGHGDVSIYMWDGEHVINWYPAPGWDVWGVWSPDNQFAWASERKGNRDIYVYRDGTPLNVSQTPTPDYYHTWSPVPR